MKKYTRKFLSVVLSVALVFGFVGLLSSLKVSAATAGSYYVKVTGSFKGSKFTFFSSSALNNTFNAGWDGTTNDSAGLVIKYKYDNGTDSTEHYDIVDLHGWSDNLDTSNYQTKTAATTISGFPIGFYFCLDQNDSPTNTTYLRISKIEIGPSSSDLTVLWSGELNLNSSNQTKKVIINQDGTNSTDGGTVTNTSGGWDMPAATTIASLSGASSIDVPFTGTATETYTAGIVKDQYGVNWHEDAAISMAETNGCTLSNGVLSVPSTANRSADYNVTVTASCGDASKTKTVSIKVFYIITFKNYDEEVLQETKYRKNASPEYTGATPQKPADAQYTYTFDGWDSELAAVTTSKTYTAVYSQTVNSYDISWLNYDGSLIKKDSVPYGTVPSYSGDTPAKDATAQYSYVFAGWDTDPVAVTGAASYTATYTELLNSYTVTWKDWDGSILETDENVDYGETPSFDGAQPSRAADAEYTYAFNGWTPAISTVSGNVIYTAKYTSTPVMYTITWKNYNGDVLGTTESAYNAMPVYSGATPVKPYTALDHYVFSGWSPSVVKVTGNAEYTAQFNEKKHAFTYINDGETHHGSCETCGYVTGAQAHVKGSDETCVFCGSALADYTVVDEAINSVPSPIYFTDESYADVTAAVAAVVRGYVDGRQAEVNAMADVINDAVDNLVPIEHTVTVPSDCTVTQSVNRSLSRYYRVAIVSAPAKNSSGKTFTYWMDSDGNTISTYLKYAFFVTEDTSVYPVYGADREDGLYLSRVTDIRNNNNGTYSILVDHSVSSTESIIGHGVLVTLDSSLGTVEQQMLISNDNIEKYSAIASSSTRTGLLEIPVIMDAPCTVYARAYIIDSDNIVHYGELQAISVGAASGDSIGDVIMTDMFESPIDQAEEEPAEIDESEPTVFEMIMSFVETIIGFIRQMLAIIKF